ncbi:NYN domain-containing protein [Methyloglobulus sp.]|uniref:NYN domain-containing protein n=1 Tax=Methyloglobulus sp. TaxID=2518622 RepID=UPI003989DEC3
MNITEIKRFALLIDADNAQAKAIDAILTEAARYGDATSRRCYGDWTNAQLSSWKNVLNKHAIQPIQQFGYTSGKNATDSALIIDAMDLLYTDKFNGFFLVSSDSDFTKLATRLREAGLEVIGIGKRSTPEAFRSACNKFIFTETIMDDAIESDESKQNKNHSSNISPVSPDKSILDKTSYEVSNDNNLKNLIKEAVDSASEEDGWANLGGVGSYINRVDSSFDPRNYGFSKFSKLIKSLPYIESKDRKNSESGGSNTYIKLKDSNA